MGIEPNTWLGSGSLCTIPTGVITKNEVDMFFLYFSINIYCNWHIHQINLYITSRSVSDPTLRIAYNGFAVEMTISHLNRSENRMTKILDYINTWRFSSEGRLVLGITKQSSRGSITAEESTSSWSARSEAKPWGACSEATRRRRSVVITEQTSGSVGGSEKT